MSYYKEKRQAYAMIDTMLKEGKSKEQIYFKVQTMFGFGNKIVDDRIDMLRQLTQEN